MFGRLLFQGAVILWLVQTAYTGGYGAASGVSNGQGPQYNGRKTQHGGGVGRMLMPSKGVGQAMGVQNGYGGYPTKGVGHGPAVGVSGGNGGRSTGYGAAAGVPNGGMKGYGAAAAAAGTTNGQGGKTQGGNPAVLPGYGVQPGPASGQLLKGYTAQAGRYGGQGTKSNGYRAPAAVVPNGNRGQFNGYGAAAGVLGGNGPKPNGNVAANGHNGLATKGNGQGAAGGPSSGNGVRSNGQGSEPMKGYGRPIYGAGPSVGMGTGRGLGVPQLARNQGMAYGSNGYNSYRAQPIGGYNGGYGHAGLGLGPQFGNGGMKGPKPGYSGAAGVPNGQGAKASGARASTGSGAVPNGYGYLGGGATKPAKPGHGNLPNGYGAKPHGYGATRGGAMRPQPGYGNGAAPNGYGSKLNGHGDTAGASVPTGYHTKSNVNGIRNGAALGGYGGKANGYGGSNPQTTKGVGAVSPSEGAKTLGTGYNMMPNGKGTKGAVTSNGLGLKGGIFSPEQPSAAPQEAVAPQQPITQGKSYKQTPLIPQATPAPGFPQGSVPRLAPESTPETSSMGPQGKGPKPASSGPAAMVPQSNPALEPAPVFPQGFVTGSAVPELKGAEADVLFGIDSTSEGDAAPESTKAIPETVTAKSAGSIIPEETLTVGVPEVAPQEEKVKSEPEPEAGPVGLGVKGLPAGETGAAVNGGRPSVSKGQGIKPAKPDCGPSGVPDGQWMKISRPGYNTGPGASTGTKTKGYGAGGYAVPGVSNGYGGGYPHAGNPKQPGYGRGAYHGAGYRNGNSYGGNEGTGEAGKSKSGYGNGYNAGVQPDYASLGQGLPTADGKSGGARQVPYNGAPVVPAGLDGISQFEPQSAGLNPNGNLGSMYGGMGGFPFGSQTLGIDAKKSNGKYGIGGLQFGGQSPSTGASGAGKYGYGGGPYGPAGGGKSSGKYGGLGAGMGGDPAPGKYGYGGFLNGGQLLGLGSHGNIAGKYGYGRMPHEAQPAALGTDAKSTGKFGLTGSQFQPEPLGLGYNGKLTNNYGGGEVPYAPQTLGLGGDAKSSGKYGNQGIYQSQPLESASQARAAGEYGTATLPYESLPLESDSAGKSYVKGELPTPAVAVEGRGMSVDRYENVGYINGHVQPQVVAFPAAPTPSPTLAHPSAPSHGPAESSITPDVVTGAGVEDLPDPAGAAGLVLDSAPAAETRGVVDVPEQPDELLQQQLPRQIHIQQQLKLHFHPQGAKNSKYDLNGFFGNSGYQG